RNLKAVIVYAGGNDGQALRLREQEIPEEIRKDPRKRRQAEWIQWNDAARWSAVYEARVRSFINALCAGGVRRVLVLLPTEGENRHWTERMERIQSLQASATQGTQCGRVIDPRGVRLKEGATMDGIHLSRSGAQAVWEHIKEAILNALRN
ncbi:MAG: hypothetical protein RMJ84_06520, partial [Sandaracinaceae bacterium]|nr:hypothetical protein [Sandaracinaceae bacterium]